MAASLQRFGLERDRMRAALASAAGISATDLDALEHLEADGPLTQRGLGDRLSLTSGAITMLVNRLEKAGWVRRRPHPATAVMSWSSCPRKPLRAPPLAWPPTTHGSGRSQAAFLPGTGTPSAASCKPPPPRRPPPPNCALTAETAPITPDLGVPGGTPIAGLGDLAKGRARRCRNGVLGVTARPSQRGCGPRPCCGARPSCPGWRQGARLHLASGLNPRLHLAEYDDNNG